MLSVIDPLLQAQLNVVAPNGSGAETTTPEAVVGEELNKLKTENEKLKTELTQIKETHFPLIREYMAYIDSPPMNPQQLYKQACSGDEVTVNTWRPTWIKNMQLSHKRFGSFKEHSMYKVFGSRAGGTVIVAGSGPSLRRNAHLLKKKPPGLTIVSVLHNYGYFEDLGIDVDYYITLDAGPIVIPEVWEAGSKLLPDGTKDEQWYWDSTRNKTLVAFTATDPLLFDKWQGKILLFSAAIPDPEVQKAMQDLEPDFYHLISAGGNVLGGSTYFARAILGATTIVWIGNDQSFSYDKKFYGWENGLDNVTGQSLRWPDVFGIQVHTWPSYFNFKTWMDYITMMVPGTWINASEGGIIGSYAEGNIRSIRQMPLSAVLSMLSVHTTLIDTFEGRSNDRPAVLF